MRNLKQIISIAMVLLFCSAVQAQEKGEVRVMVFKNEDGNITKVDKSYSAEDKVELQKLLEENGVQMDLDEIKSKGEIQINKTTNGSNQDVLIKVLNEEDFDGEIEKEIKVFSFTSDESESANKNEFVIELKKAAEEGDVEKIMNLTKGGQQEMIFFDDEDIDLTKEGSKVIIKTVAIESDEEFEGDLSTMIFTKKIDCVKQRNLPTQIEQNFGENSSIQDLKLYPNPANDNFNMSFHSKEAKDYNLSITDSKGAILFEKQLNNFKGNYNEGFDLSKEDSGVYFFNLISEGEKICKQIIVQ